MHSSCQVPGSSFKLPIQDLLVEVLRRILFLGSGRLKVQESVAVLDLPCPSPPLSAPRFFVRRVFEDPTTTLPGAVSGFSARFSVIRDHTQAAHFEEVLDHFSLRLFPLRQIVLRTTEYGYCVRVFV